MSATNPSALIYDLEIAKAKEMQAVADREIVASWMFNNGFATGHGDTICDLLSELEWQVKELRLR